MTTLVTNLPRVTMSFLWHLVIDLFWLPVRLMKFGPKAFPLMLHSLGAQTRLSRWRLGLGPVRLVSGGIYSYPLPSGAPLQVSLHLLGGKTRAAFMDVRSNGQSMGTFYFPHPADDGDAIESVSFNAESLLPREQLFDHCADKVCPSDQPQVRAFLAHVCTLIQ